MILQYCHNVSFVLWIWFGEILFDTGEKMRVKDETKLSTISVDKYVDVSSRPWRGLDLSKSSAFFVIGFVFFKCFIIKCLACFLNLCLWC